MSDNEAAKSAEQSVESSEDRHKTAVAELEKQLAALRGKVDGLAQASPPAQKAAPKAEAPKPKYSRAQLREMVNNGTITEDQMDEQLEKQLREQISYETRSTLAQEVSAAKTQSKVETQIESYMSKYPSLNDKSSDTFKKVEKAFNSLTALGDPSDSAATELKALMVALGPVEASRVPQGVDKRPETFQETGGSAPSDSPSAEGPEWAKGLTGGQRNYYKGLIDKGIYKGFNDPQLKSDLEGARRRATQ